MVRSNVGARAVSLVTSGVVPERRFAFFDQVHTTGMDILTAPCAKADMNFRDYAQGAFRMRKVGKGQSIHLFVIPEVQTRIAAELGPSSSLILDVPKWLLLNSCRSESLQSLIPGGRSVFRPYRRKLLAQELTNGWRKQALQHLCADAAAHSKMPTAERMRRFEGPQAQALRSCLGPFQELWDGIPKTSPHFLQDHISFAVDDQVILPRSYREALQQQCDQHQQFCDDVSRQQNLLNRIDAESKAGPEHEDRPQLLVD
eukprot:s8_g33.t1